MIGAIAIGLTILAFLMMLLALPVAHCKDAPKAGVDIRR